MADNKEPKPLKDLNDDELMAEIKKVVEVDKVAKLGKNSKVIKAALEQKSKRSKN